MLTSLYLRSAFRLKAKVDRIRGCNSNVLSVLTWNILAPIWVNRTQLKATGVDINLLNDDVRLKIALHEIKRAEPDIVNLQEVICNLRGMS